MGKILKAALFAAAAAFAASSPASATLVDAPVPDNATITINGYQWAWAAPAGPEFVDLSYQAQFGWLLPSAEQLLLAPSAFDFMYAGANVPLGGSDPISGANFAYTSGTLNSAAALASPYFSNYSHGDWCNAPGSACGFGENPWNVPNTFNESLVLRALAVQGVPEPATWAMMLIGFGAVGASMRRQKALQRTLKTA